MCRNRPPHVQPPGSASSKGAGAGILAACSPEVGDPLDAAKDLGAKGYPLADAGKLAVAWSVPGSLPSSGYSAPRSDSMGGTAAGKLPPGLEVSVPVRAAPGPPRPPRLGCPPPPPPSLTSSMACGRPRSVRTAAAASPGLAGSPVPGTSPLAGAGPLPSPPNGGPLTPHALAAAAARQRTQGAGGGTMVPLLAQMPTPGWQRSVVDYSAIHFVLRPDGSYEEIGSGASATVGGVRVLGCGRPTVRLCMIVPNRGARGRAGQHAELDRSVQQA